MDEDLIVAAYVVIDEVLAAAGHRSHPLAGVTDAEVLTVAVVAAACFQNHHAVALAVMHKGYPSAGLSTSRFNRRLHALGSWLQALLELLGELFAAGETFVLDSLPVPVCRRVRARRCRKVRGTAYCGYCAAKREPFFGWRLHLATTATGVPVAFTLLPASLHDLTPVHELTFGLPTGAAAYGDKAFNSKADEATILADTGVRLVPIRRKNMAPNPWADRLALRAHRPRIEATNSQLEAMGLQRLRARTNAGLELKVHASLLALTLTNAR
jgi:hypothetical protein